MRAAGLLAWSFIRQNRWPTIALLAWVALSGGLAKQEASQSLEEALYLYKLAMVYVIGFTAFLAASVIQSERSSRRILAVLSKSVSRSEYLLGIVLTFAGIAAGCCLVMLFTGAWIFGRSSLVSLLELMAAVLAACLLAGTASLLFSTFLNPILAVVAASALLAASSAVRNSFPLRELVLPAYPLMSSIMEFSFDSGWQVSGSALLGAVVEAAVVWMVACWVFAHRDIAVAVD
ncbi:MAG TPA: hypothetical protein VEG30_03800 [Terriglobales bacterium]|nr:hypothetical protein [Terriglobales bacterium]